MRVLLETSARGRPGGDRGIGRYLDALMRANEVLGNEVEEIDVRVGAGRVGEFTALGRRSASLLRRDFELFHAPTAYYSAIDARRRPRVVSVLDVIPLDVREHRQTGLKARLFHSLAGRADVVLTLSEHAAGRITQLLDVSPDRIVVASLPAADAFTPVGPTPDTLPARYVAMLLDLRTPDPRKRAEWLPAIAAALAREGVGIVVAGGGSELLAVDGVVGLGRVSDEEWATVLRGAQALVYTSSYEGQGMPPLEAISCGTPVVAMANTALPEVVGAAGVLVDEVAGAEAPRRLAVAALELALDGSARAAFADLCASQAARFTGAVFSERVAEAYRRAGAPR